MKHPFCIRAIITNESDTSSTDVPFAKPASSGFTGSDASRLSRLCLPTPCPPKLPHQRGRAAPLYIIRWLLNGQFARSLMRSHVSGVDGDHAPFSCATPGESPTPNNVSRPIGDHPVSTSSGLMSGQVRKAVERWQCGAAVTQRRWQPLAAAMLVGGVADTSTVSAPAA